ncbi:Uncharacterised protein [Legionella beliardensis]|uniref:Uncharacterized protein n=1 Tax=Legionella beliardensis TaxID=91822 RepID=A0A378I351_9GAMM|nr:hypothetical protein [Legionella beliardensis]STX29180.1 Uncharacterised protein [Legionella beliardensis]
MKIIVLHGYDKELKKLGIYAFHSDSQITTLIHNKDFKSMGFSGKCIATLDTITGALSLNEDWLTNLEITTSEKKLLQATISKGGPCTDKIEEQQQELIGKFILHVLKCVKDREEKNEHSLVDKIEYVGDVNLGFPGQSIFPKFILDSSIHQLFSSKEVKVFSFSSTLEVIEQASLLTDLKENNSLTLYVRKSGAQDKKSPLYSSDNQILNNNSVIKPIKQARLDSSHSEIKHCDDTEKEAIALDLSLNQSQELPKRKPSFKKMFFQSENPLSQMQEIPQEDNEDTNTNSIT